MTPNLAKLLLLAAMAKSLAFDGIVIALLVLLPAPDDVEVVPDGHPRAGGQEATGVAAYHSLGET